MSLNGRSLGLTLALSLAAAMVARADQQVRDGDHPTGRDGPNGWNSAGGVTPAGTEDVFRDAINGTLERDAGPAAPTGDGGAAVPDAGGPAPAGGDDPPAGCTPDAGGTCTSITPEPSSMLLVAGGLIGIAVAGLMQRRKRAV